MGGVVSKIICHTRERRDVTALEPTGDSTTIVSNSLRMKSPMYTSLTDEICQRKMEGNLVPQVPAHSSETLDQIRVCTFENEIRPFLKPVEKYDGSSWQKECLRNCKLSEAFHLLSPEECKLLIRPRSDYYRSKVQNDGGTTRIDESRTSSTAWHQGFSGPAGEVYHKLLTRAEQVCKIPYFWGALESGLQLVKYDHGQKFGAHFDSSSTASNKKRGRVTLLVYLNDDFQGGETNFETMKCKIKPEAGKGVLWFTHMENENQAHLASKHSGETVRNGTKYIATQWWRLVEAAPRYE